MKWYEFTTGGKRFRVGKHQTNKGGTLHYRALIDFDQGGAWISLGSGVWDGEVISDPRPAVANRALPMHVVDAAQAALHAPAPRKRRAEILIGEGWRAELADVMVKRRDLGSLSDLVRTLIDEEARRLGYPIPYEPAGVL